MGPVPFPRGAEAQAGAVQDVPPLHGQHSEKVLAPLAVPSRFHQLLDQALPKKS